MGVFPELISLLQAKGFFYSDKQPVSGWLTLTGSLNTRFGPVECEVLIDRTHQTHPQVRLLKIPSQLQPIAPHVTAGGHFCYVAASTEVVDIFDPIGFTLLSLDRAAYVLDRIMAKEMLEDLEEEFFAYWISDQWCLSDVQRQDSGALQLLGLQRKGVMFLTDDVNRSAGKIQSLGGQIKKRSATVAMIVTKVKPRPSLQVWPPETLSDILHWQQMLDRTCCRKIKKHIIKAYRSGYDAQLIIIESPSMPYGFLVTDLQEHKESAITRLSRERIYDRPIKRLMIAKIDDRYLAQRNVPDTRSLAGKKIALVGCGTIGGYLAEMLIKSGAGTIGGKLTLVDSEILLPNNLGRHRLGFNRLFQSKAVALCDEFKLIMPSANTIAHPVDVRETNLADYDLLIDATGEEAIGHWLSAKYGKLMPMLHAWIEGAGVAVRTLMRKKEGECCYRCLSGHTQHGNYLSVQGGFAPVFSGHGCEGLFVPFPASVSVQAASLAIDATLAWANETPWPALSTRVISREHIAAGEDCCPPVLKGCPACRS